MAKADWMAQEIGKGSWAFHLLINRRGNLGNQRRWFVTFAVPVQMVAIVSNQHLQQIPEVRDSFSCASKSYGWVSCVDISHCFPSFSWWNFLHKACLQELISVVLLFFYFCKQKNISKLPSHSEIQDRTSKSRWEKREGSVWIKVRSNIKQLLLKRQKWKCFSMPKTINSMKSLFLVCIIKVIQTYLLET